MLLLSIFPGCWLLAAVLGISTDEPVNQNHNGSLFMLSFCALMAISLFVGMGVAHRVVSWWLVRFSRYSPEVVKLAMTWRAYPDAWFATSDDR